MYSKMVVHCSVHSVMGFSVVFFLLFLQSLRATTQLTLKPFYFDGIYSEDFGYGLTTQKLLGKKKKINSLDRTPVECQRNNKQKFSYNQWTS